MLTYLFCRICSLSTMTAPAPHMKCWTVSVLVLDWFPIIICSWKGAKVLLRMSCQTNVTASCRLLRHWLPTLVSAWTSCFNGNITHSQSGLHYCRSVSLSPWLVFCCVCIWSCINFWSHALLPDEIWLWMMNWEAYGKVLCHKDRGCVVPVCTMDACGE